MPKHSLNRDQPAPDDSRDESYVPKTPAHWIDPDPRTIGKALDNLALPLGLLNGTFAEQFDATVSSDGATITMSLEKTGTGDLTMLFSDGVTALDTTPALTMALTAGSDTSPQKNFIYIPQSTKVLTKSTSAWPSAEHIRIGFFFLPSAGLVQTEGGGHINQNVNEGTDATNQGHLSDLGARVRAQHAIYKSGVDLTVSITVNVGVPDNVNIAVTAGVVFQMHPHATPVVDTAAGDHVHVVNDSIAAYDPITDLNDLLLDSTGASMAGKYFNLDIWGVVNKTGEHTSLYCNLPSGSYNKLSDAIADPSGFNNDSLPSAFNIDSSTGFLIARVTFRHQNASGGTWTHAATKDLRGLSPATAVGGGSGLSQTEFADNSFAVFDDGDPTKVINLQAASITTGNTRTITMADEDVDLGALTTSQFADDAVTYAKLENLANATILGRIAAGAGDAQELTPAEVRALLGVEPSEFEVTLLAAGAGVVV